MIEESMTCYARDEARCEDGMCLRTGCRLQNEALRHPAPGSPDWSKYNVSVDVSTGDDITASDRIYGAVIDAQPEADGKITLLCEYTSDNFAMRAVVPKSTAINSDAHTILRDRYARANKRSDATRGGRDWASGYNLGYASAVGDIIDALGVTVVEPTTSPEPDAVREALVPSIRNHFDSALHWRVGEDGKGLDNGLTFIETRDLLTERLLRGIEQYVAALSRPAPGGWEDKPIYEGCAEKMFRDFTYRADGHFREDVIAACVRTIKHAIRWRDAAPITRNDRGSEAR